MLRAAADAATTHIHGLGRGGNVPDAARLDKGPAVPASHAEQRRSAGRDHTDYDGGAGGDARGQTGDWANGGGAGEAAAPPREGSRQPGRGRGRGRGREGGPTASQRDRLWKDQNKSSVGNHNRKDRAAKKAGML